ncbi:hypothetical protein M427DRAFT_40746 [Gonapodya prolifera JEL478]|uniref:Stc1 domain-containing protein n=1 Tax=Gonapodya prolifera (strain JEL478) TaxID=1344416 RepID=A0A139AWJ4_GONPJ|nr:hypothetical protein M427DRAFT_40746 [Gonapodya prolifera JEL478]|eukprot:KXS21077.1 hypothetical protein M427DRAFT_40746 [Gonapodya prolifera JEL478]
MAATARSPEPNPRFEAPTGQQKAPFEITVDLRKPPPFYYPLRVGIDNLKCSRCARDQSFTIRNYRKDVINGMALTKNKRERERVAANVMCNDCKIRDRTPAERSSVGWKTCLMCSMRLKNDLFPYEQQRLAQPTCRECYEQDREAAEWQNAHEGKGGGEGAK